MRGDLSHRVRLFVLEHPGAGVVFEKPENGTYVPVHILSSGDRARKWTESHYEDLEWLSPHRAIASVGALREQPRLSPSPVAGRPWEHRPVTYETSEVRTRLPELLAGAKGDVILQQCEEYVPESDRWEPFVSILWESTW